MAVVILISGRGSNMRSIVRAVRAGVIPARIAAVVSNRPDAAGLDYARSEGLTTRVVDHTAHAGRREFEAELFGEIERLRPGLIVLAGFMRVLTAEFVARFSGRILNIHPSLLPRHRGLRTHQRALDAGDGEHGVSVHFVTAELDGGPVIAQTVIPILTGDTADTLASRVLALEHRLYPEVVRWFCEGRLECTTDTVRLDGRVLAEPIRLEFEPVDHA
jgi:phosphoribosylglycinamide formyltransferase-1